MRVRYGRAALAEFGAIFDYIADRNPASATRVIGKIRESIDRLGEFPLSGRRSEVPGIRELPLTRYPYIVFYAVDEERGEVQILSIRHVAQDRYFG